MISYTKAQFSKNNNKIIQLKIYQYEYHNPIKMMLLTVTYHSPSTTFSVQQSVLGRVCAGLQAIHQSCSISPLHNPRNNLVNLSLQSLHRRFSTRQLLASKSPCNAYISKGCPKIGLIASY